MKVETYIVDSFTDEPFKGNPAGVCLLQDPIEDSQMLTIAQELGFSETAFVIGMFDSQDFQIRFFSPKMEIPLCGHATLASAKVMFSKMPEFQTLKFINTDGLHLDISKIGDQVQMIFPIYETTAQDAPKALLDALGIEAIQNSVYNAETNILLLEIAHSETLRALSPDFERLKNSHDSINGVLITAPSDQGEYDFESRYFWPWSGTNEDPVTGGTHTFLAKYWGLKLNKTKMRSYQCSERTGFMEVELINKTQMTITSSAQIVLKGELYLS